MRHLISGDDCAIAGEATAAAAAPVAETFRKSRRFIKPSPYWEVSLKSPQHSFRRRDFASNRRRSSGGLTRKSESENATKARLHYSDESRIAPRGGKFLRWEVLFWEVLRSQIP